MNRKELNKTLKLYAFRLRKLFGLHGFHKIKRFNTFNPDFTLSSSSTTSRELLSQFSTCSGWRWFEVGEKLKKIIMYWWASFMEIFRDVRWCFNASWGLKGLRVKKILSFKAGKCGYVSPAWYRMDLWPTRVNPYLAVTVYVRFEATQQTRDIHPLLVQC